MLSSDQPAGTFSQSEKLMLFKPGASNRGGIATDTLPPGNGGSGTPFNVTVNSPVTLSPYWSRHVPLMVPNGFCGVTLMREQPVGSTPSTSLISGMCASTSNGSQEPVDSL